MTKPVSFWYMVKISESQQISFIGQSALYSAKHNKKRGQRPKTDRDIDKALRRMALEEGKNLTESVNNALRAGLTKYL